jgi:hypothetical protein
MADNLPAYLQISNSWTTEKLDIKLQMANGAVIVSSSAFYMFTDSRPELVCAAGGALGGLVGGLVAAVAGKVQSIGDTLNCVAVSDLPPDMLKHPDWPIKKLKKTHVVILPFADVQRASMPWWGPLKMTVGDKKFAVQAYTFKRKRIRTMLESGGIKFS